MRNITKQLELLSNSHYSVLLVDRTKEKTAFNYNLYGRTALTVEEVKKAVNTLHYYNNNKSHDIYIKAELGDFYNLVIDDLTSETLIDLLSICSFNYVVKSSTGNYQAIINIKKTDFTKAQADYLVKFLNEKYGDPNFSGANHYFRLVSFHNKKAKNNNELVEFLPFKNIRTEEETIAYFKEVLKNFKDNSSKSFKSFENVSISFNFEELTEQEKKDTRREVMAEIALCKKMFKNLDFSAVDFRIVKRLFKKGYSKGKIATALTLFTDFQDRHNDPSDYLIRTINKATIPN